MDEGDLEVNVVVGLLYLLDLPMEVQELLDCAKHLSKIVAREQRTEPFLDRRTDAQEA